MRVLDLFSGIGGMALGLEEAGMEMVGFCEIEAFPSQLLRRRWPGVRKWRDVRNVRHENVARSVGAVDLVAGGFPCQDISAAGRGEGLAGKRSGLWFEMLRVIEEIGPRWVIAENVPALRTKGLETVLQGLNALGYSAVWNCIPAAAVGARHQRDRIWIVARADSAREPQPQRGEQTQREWSGDCGESVRDADSERLAFWQSFNRHLEQELQAAQRADRSGFGVWSVEPALGRVVDGFPGRVDRIKALGNAVVPQIPMMIGRVIMRMEGAKRE